MAKIVSLCILSLLLFLTCSSHVIARPVPTISGDAPVEVHGAKGDEVEREGCEREGEEECLMRKTLEAHIDYIYTQKQKQP